MATTPRQGFGKGEDHFKVKALAESKAKVIEAVGSGATTHQAMDLVGKKHETLRVWMSRDSEFAAALAEAKERGEAINLPSGQTSKEDINFADFSKIFLNQTVFPHHQNWIDLLEGKDPSYKHPAMTYEPGHKNRLLANVPPEHAKSTVVTVNYPTYRICMDPNVRIIVVSKTITKAREFVYSIKNRLSHPRWLKMQNTYGPAGGWKEDAETWRTDTVYLGTESRDSSEKDPTIQALGMGGQIYGSRADLIILDDCITTSNAHEWEKQLNWLQKEVITRLGKNGKLLIVGTRISAIDLYREIRNPEHWSGGKSPFSYLAMPALLEAADDPKDWVTLWPKSDVPWDGDEDELPDENGLFPKWDGPTLFQRRSEVTPSTWALVYQQEDIQEDAIFSPAVVSGSTNGARRVGSLKPGAVGHPKSAEGYTIIGLDPAIAGKTALVAITYNRADGKIYVLDCLNMADASYQKINAAIKVFTEKYRPQEFRVEINAFQKAFELDDELRQWLAGRGVRLSSHFTGKNKWDTNFGVASMSPLFGTLRDGKHLNNNLIELPSTEGSEGMKALVQQLITWKPDTKSPTDCVMALWFAVIRARELIQNGTRVTPYLNNRWATKAQMESRHSINLEDAFASQWQEQYS